MKTQVIAHPKSKKPRIEKDLIGALHVYVSAPPLEGKANKAIIEALAKYYKVKKQQVCLLSGAKAKKKTFEIITSK